MKKLIAIALAVSLVLALAVGSGIALADKPGNPEDGYNGNGAPSGPHYNLNIIGVPKDKTATMDNNSGHRIFVKLDGKSRILLTEGPFQVLDANGTDGLAAFQLPNPDPDGDGTTVYSVYARALGKPGGKATMNTGAIDPGPDGIFGTSDENERELIPKQMSEFFANIFPLPFPWPGLNSV